MTTVDVLQVLIEGDATGLTSIFKDGLNQGENLVSELNALRVDWTSILSKSISPAIITGIASLFASAIVNTLQFNQAFADMGASVGMTSNQISQFGDQVQGISMATGVSDTKDLGTAFTQLYPILGNNITATTGVVQQLAELEAAGMGTASNLASTLLPVMQAWGVTTQAQAETVIQAFLTASQSSGQSIASLAQSFAGFQAGLITGGAKISDINDLVITFGVNVGKLGFDQAISQFKLLSDGVDGTHVAISNVLGGLTTLRTDITSGATEKALATMGSAIQKQGSFIAVQGFGVPLDAYNAFKNALAEYPDISAAVKKAKTNQKSVADIFKSTDTSLRDLNKAWATTKAILTDTSSWSPIKTALDGIVIDYQKIYDLTRGNSSDPVGTAIKVGTDVANVAGIGASAAVGGEIGGVLGSLLGPVGTLVGYVGGAAAGGGIATLIMKYVPKLIDAIESIGGKNSTTTINNTNNTSTSTSKTGSIKTSVAGFYGQNVLTQQ